MKRCLRLSFVFVLLEFPVFGYTLDVQLPFYDGKSYQCTQNSDDAPTHQSGNVATQYDLDFGLPNGSIVVAAADGTLRHRENPNGFGLYARVDHSDGNWTMYAHLSGYIVSDGQRVFAGQPIAYSGNSGLSIGTGGGYHLHIGVHEDDAHGGVGISQPMRVYAFERDTGTQGYFGTGLQGSSDFTCGLGSLGHTYESRPIGKTFSDFSCRKLSGSNGVLCWNLNPTTCEDGSDHVRYFRNARGAMESESNVDTWRWCLEDTGQSANVFSFLEGGYGVGGDDGGSSPPPSTPLPNLQIEEITVHIIPEDGDNTRLIEETSLMNVGETYQVNVWPVSKEEHCQNGNATGNEDFEVKTDTFYKVAMSEDEVSWTLLSRSETHCKYMDEDNSKKEMISFTVPIEASGKRVYFKSKVDAPGNIFESNEDDNWSNAEWYPVNGACDLVISSGNLTGGRVSLNQGEPYGFGATVLNLGPDPCPSDTRLSYFYMKPGDTSWRFADGDDTPAFKLLPGQVNEEWMTTDTLVADIPGTYQARICADTNNGNRETSEANNCFDFSYPVIAIVWKPDFIVSALWIAEGTTIKSGTRVHPHCVVKNIGNAKPTKDMRLAYYINSNQYRDDDNVEANEMCVGCEQHEQVNNDNIKLGDRGTRSFMCCVDYQGAIPELNEGNNCATMYFTVVR